MVVLDESLSVACEELGRLESHERLGCLLEVGGVVSNQVHDQPGEASEVKPWDALALVDVDLRHETVLEKALRVVDGLELFGLLRIEDDHPDMLRVMTVESCLCE